MPHVSSFQQENTQKELISEPNTSELLLKLPSPVSPGMHVVLTAIQPQFSCGSQMVTEYEMGGAIRGSLPWLCTRVHFSFLKAGRDFSGIPAGRNLPAKARDTSSIPDLGRSHTPWSNKAHVPQLLSLCSRARKPQLLSPCAATTEARNPRALLRSKRSHLSEKPREQPPLTATREKPAQQWRPSTAKMKQ